MKEGRQHIIGMDQSRRIEFPDRGITGGISVCIGAGIQQTMKKKIGFLGHFMIGDEGEVIGLDDFLRTSMKEIGTTTSVKIALAGNIPDPEMIRECGERIMEECLERARKIEKLIRGMGFTGKQADLQLRHDPTDESCFTMEVDTTKKGIAVRRIQLEPYID